MRPYPPAVGDDWALFLDLDGTLVEIVDDPAAVAVPPRVLGMLLRLTKQLGGAVALVSGRPIATLDRLLAPLKLPAAGIHGLERRNAAGALAARKGDADAMAAARKTAQAFARTAHGVLVEDKGLSLALHYRRAASREKDVRELVARVIGDSGGRLHAQDGNMVIEIRPPGPNKGSVVEAFMAEPPFAGRKPAFVGDDITDEHGFATVNRMGGYAVRVSAAEVSAACYQVAGVSDLLAWLDVGATAASATSG